MQPTKPLSVRIMRHEPELDEYRRYLTDAPSPSKFASTLREVDDGDIAAAVEMSEEMESKDQHLQGVMNTRRQAVTALPWDIEPDSDAYDVEAAQVTAKYCRSRLKSIRSWPQTLKHLGNAVGPGIGVTELIWRNGQLVATKDVPGDRLNRPWGENQVHILTKEDRVDGYPALSPKFAVFTPEARAGGPLRCTMMRAQAYAWVIKHYLIADWAAFSETFGMPMRVAKVGSGMSSTERQKVRDMLKNMGSDTYGVFSKDQVEIELLRTDQGQPPFKDMVEWIERKQSILALGQTLTTEQGTVGSLALGRVHENVRASILFDDLANEANFIRDRILRPMVALKFPDTPMPVPVFKRKTYEAKNIESDRLALDQLNAAKEYGLRVDTAEVYERLGLRRPEDGATDVIDFGPSARTNGRDNPDPATP